MLTLVENASRTAENRAIISGKKTYTYGELLGESCLLASLLLRDTHDLAEAPVAFMISPGFDYVAVQWAIWQAGGIAVPLCITYPPPSLQHVIDNTGAKIVVGGREYESILAPLTDGRGIQLLILESVDRGSIDLKQLPKIVPDRKAMILYTSGTTSLPKGVVTTHKNIEAQIRALVTAWEWSSSDHILCALPLHHVHGVINVISCAMWSGATVEFVHPFSVESVFSVFERGDVNLFMAVPTIYFKLITYWESLSAAEQQSMNGILSKFRLMVSGSAALPVSTMEKWEKISGHRLLERYGMTEIGMGISNPYRGERKAGYIGQPLPGVTVRLTDDQNRVVVNNDPGEIQIRGENVFAEYWNNPAATEKAFTPDGWFRTGDVAVVEHGYYRILGRDSVDIIKSGGYKISALEIEEVIRTYPAVVDVSVVGLENEEWGELVAAALMVREAIDMSELNSWLRERMPPYKTPRRYTVAKELPRNAMGKILKNEVKKLF